MEEVEEVSGWIFSGVNEFVLEYKKGAEFEHVVQVAG